MRGGTYDGQASRQTAVLLDLHEHSASEHTSVLECHVGLNHVKGTVILVSGKAARGNLGSHTPTPTLALHSLRFLRFHRISLVIPKSYYRAMHFSAKRGIAIVILSVCYLHAMHCDQIG